jgi:type I restriction enzyme, S subunit
LVSTGLYNIPETWFSEDLGELIEDLQSGFASGERDDNGIIQLRMNNISSTGRFDFQEMLKVPVPPDIDKFDLRKDDILFNNTNSLDLIGKTAIVSERLDCTFSNHITRIRVKKNRIFPYWVYLLFLRYKERFVFRAICNTHVGQSGIGMTELQNLRIFYPPVIEQQKIASILSKVDELIQKTDQIIELTQRLKRGLMQRLLTKGIGHARFKKVQVGLGLLSEEIPEEWNISRLDECSTIERGKFTHRPRDDPRFCGGKYPFIQTGDVEKSNGYIQAFSQTLNEQGLSVSKLFPEGIVVMTIAANIGSTAITTFPVCFPDSVVGITPAKINTRLLEYYLRTRKRSLEMFATVNAQPNINLEILKPLIVPIPPREEQNKIVSVLSGIDSNTETDKDYRSYLLKIKKGLMQKLLTGKIRVKV